MYTCGCFGGPASVCQAVIQSVCQAGSVSGESKCCERVRALEAFEGLGTLEGSDGVAGCWSRYQPPGAFLRRGRLRLRGNVRARGPAAMGAQAGCISNIMQGGRRLAAAARINFGQRHVGRLRTQRWAGGVGIVGSHGCIHTCMAQACMCTVCFLGHGGVLLQGCSSGAASGALGFDVVLTGGRVRVGVSGRAEQIGIR
jgi:hypothetical protein